jgi:hypothetical protein
VQRIEIQWVDSKAGNNEWEYLEGLESLKPVVCTSVGFLIEDTPEYKTIAHTISPSQVLGRIAIPSGCITKVSNLTAREGRKDGEE